MQKGKKGYTFDLYVASTVRVKNIVKYSYGNILSGKLMGNCSESNVTAFDRIGWIIRQFFPRCEMSNDSHLSYNGYEIKYFTIYMRISIRVFQI